MRMKKVIVFWGLAVAFSGMAMDKESSTAKLESNELFAVNPAAVTAPALSAEKKYVFNGFQENVGSAVNMLRLLDDIRNPTFKFPSNLLEAIKDLNNTAFDFGSVNTVVLSTKIITVDSEGNVISESETVVDPENQE